MTPYYKIRDKNTGLFKDSNFRTWRSSSTGLTDAQKYGFNQIGHLWDNLADMRSFLNKWAAYPKSITAARKAKSMLTTPENWEVVKYELVDIDTFKIEEIDKVK